MGQLQSNQSDASKFCHRPLPVRLINRVGSVLERLGISLGNRSAESLIKSACRKTGLKDWGDESFKEPLRVLLESYRKDGKLNVVGWFMVHGLIMGHLANRLLIQDELRRHPEIAEQNICRPLYIVGLPRTGTTLLYRLLANDPQSRPLLHWESIRPTPPPDPDSHAKDPRIIESEKLLKFLDMMAPLMKTIYPSQAKGPEECNPLIGNAFCFPSFGLFGHVDRYSKWLRERDMIPVYRYYRLQLRLLQSRFPTDRWLLKSPYHLFALDALLTVLPDACVIQTHRDPLKLIPSICSLYSAMRGMNTDHLDLRRIGQECLDEWSSMYDHASEVRDSADSARFFDVHYQDMSTDPIGVVRNIYDHFGYELDTRVEERMRKWLAENPKHKAGVHRYTLEQFGLDRDMVDNRFSAYCERFGITPE